ncbi:hypothetical protein HDK77DRAFT_178084 [Phyllosticta capitalensis]
MKVSCAYVSDERLAWCVKKRETRGVAAGSLAVGEVGRPQRSQVDEALRCCYALRKDGRQVRVVSISISLSAGLLQVILETHPRGLSGPYVAACTALSLYSSHVWIVEAFTTQSSRRRARSVKTWSTLQTNKNRFCQRRWICQFSSGLHNTAHAS